MFVRSKNIAGRKYLYLVEGRRLDGRVKQFSLSYLGPLWKLYAGIPDQTKKRVEAKIGKKPDWKRVTAAIAKIPISLEELELLRKNQFSRSLYFRKRRYARSRRSKNFSPKRKFDFLDQREKGELKALARLAARSFEERFEQIDELTYRMR